MMLRDLVLAIHVMAGIAGLIVGPVAMVARKRRGMHTRAGEAYHWLFLAVAVSAIVLAALDWSRLWWFTLIAVFSYAFALRGYLAAKRRRAGWVVRHLVSQAGSYIALVTAVLVVNSDGGLVVWFLPTLIGSPVIAWVRSQVVKGRRPKGAIASNGSPPAERRSAAQLRICKAARPITRWWQRLWMT